MSLSYVEKQVIAALRPTIVSAYINHALAFLDEAGRTCTLPMEQALQGNCYMEMDAELTGSDILKYIEVNGIELCDIFSESECEEIAEAYIMRSLEKWTRAYLAWLNQAP